MRSLCACKVGEWVNREGAGVEVRGSVEECAIGKDKDANKKDVAEVYGEGTESNNGKGRCHA